MPDSLAMPSAIASVVTGSLIGFSGVPIARPSTVVLDDVPPQAASKEPPTVMPPVVMTKFRKKSLRRIVIVPAFVY